MDTDVRPLTTEEEAFHAAWLGGLWPRYRHLFETDAGGRRFEWRAALYPLWLGVPGLYVQLVAVIAFVLAVCTALAARDSFLEVGLVLTMAGGFLALWPAMTVGLLVASTQEDASALLALVALTMMVLSIALGMLTPRWIVAEGRRRWSRHVARVAAGEAPALPRAITSTHPLRLVLLLVIVAVPLWLLIFPPHHHEPPRVYVAAMRSDLRNLVTAEESYYADSVRYTAVLSALLHARSTGVTIHIVAATDSGWAATARHQSTTRTCAIFVGTAVPPMAGGTEGEPLCTPAVR